MKKLFPYGVVLLMAIVPCVMQGQVDSLRQYREQYQSQWKQYQDSIEGDFDKMLRQRWVEMDIFTGEHRLPKPAPIYQPEMDTQSVETRELPTSEALQLSQIDSVMVTMCEAVAPKRIEKIQFDFYGRRLGMTIDQSISELRLRNISEWEVSAFWHDLDETSYGACMRQVLDLKRKLQLNDWGMYDMVCHLAKSIYPNRENEQVVFVIYVLNKLGYESKLGRQEQQLVCLLRFESTVYDVPFTMVGDYRYYIFNPNQKGERSYGKVYTYRMAHPNTVRGLDLTMKNSPLLGTEVVANPYQYKVAKTPIKFSVSQELMRFYNHYPQTELQYYATAMVDATFEAQVDLQLLPMVAQKSQREAVGLLLDYLQHGFGYKNDEVSFGKERTFFCEENFYYGENDCEDRAVLFAYLVKHLLQLDVVLAVYSNHVATGVCFTDEVRGDYYKLGNRRYVVCDPTYVGAQVGQLAVQHVADRPIIVKIERN